MSPERGHTLCARVGQLKRMSRFHKSHLIRKFTAQSEHPDQAPAFTATVRTLQCGHTVWGKRMFGFWYFFYYFINDWWFRYFFLEWSWISFTENFDSWSIQKHILSKFYFLILAKPGFRGSKATNKSAGNGISQWPMILSSRGFGGSMVIRQISLSGALRSGGKTLENCGNIGNF